MARRKKKNRVPKEIAQIVVDRADGMCEIMSRETGCNGRAEQLHHRQLRSQGGKHDVENMIHICEPCHHWAHMHPAVAYTKGWIVKSTKNPSSVPIERRGKLVLLTEHGGLENTAIKPLDV